MISYVNRIIEVLAVHNHVKIFIQEGLHITINRILEHFVEVFVDTPIEVCEQRDLKGMYAKARRGEIKGFTGIDDPYEAPEHAEIVLDTVANTPEENAHVIVNYLIDQGLIRPTEHAPVVSSAGNG